VSPRALRGIAGAAALSLAIVAMATGCGGSDSDSGSGGGTIALLLPDNRTTRYETYDRPEFEKKVEALCEECKVLYLNAGGDPAKQQQQAEAAMAQGADVLVVDPVDVQEASTIMPKAKAKHVPVVSYDELISNARVDYYVSFDSEKVGELQGETLSRGLKDGGNPRGPIVMLNGTYAETVGGPFIAGVYNSLFAKGIKVSREYTTPGPSEANARKEMEKAIAALGADGFEGVYAVNDEVAGGAIAAMKSAGIDPEERPSTGQDATLAAVQRILASQQYMTVYKPFQEEARAAARFAVDLVETGEVPDAEITDEPANGLRDVPALLIEPVAVTRDNVKTTVVADGFIAADELCTAPYAEACREAGIS
jgi:D-xylose transport system substrate-binding protein